MRLIALAVSLLAQEWRGWQLDRLCRRHDHQMVMLTEGPVCARCGRCWSWRR